MENASKALIIAGAILLAILLISLGIFIFNQAQDTISNSGMSQAEVNAFNNKFVKYEGQQKGSVVRSLLQEVVASNNDENLKNDGVAITIEGNSGATATSSSGIVNTKKYNILITGYDTKGRVNKIKIDKIGS